MWTSSLALQQRKCHSYVQLSYVPCAHWQVFRIIDTTDPSKFVDVAAESEEDRKSWRDTIVSKVEVKPDGCVDLFCCVAFPANLNSYTVPNLFRVVRDKKKKSNISQQLSDLVFYSQSVSFPGLENKYGPKDYHKMSSFIETEKAEALSKSSAPVCCLSSFARCIFTITSFLTLSLSQDKILTLNSATCRENSGLSISGFNYNVRIKSH